MITNVSKLVSSYGRSDRIRTCYVSSIPSFSMLLCYQNLNFMRFKLVFSRMISLIICAFGVNIGVVTPLFWSCYYDLTTLTLYSPTFLLSQKRKEQTAAGLLYNERPPDRSFSSPIGRFFICSLQKK